LTRRRCCVYKHTLHSCDMAVSVDCRSLSRRVWNCSVRQVALSRGGPLKSVCENCFNTINVREEAIGKRYRCKVCGTTCVVQAEEEEYVDDIPARRPQRPRRPKTTRKPKRSRASDAEGSIARGCGFGCLYMVLGFVGFGILSSLIGPAIFHGPQWDHRAQGYIAGKIGMFIVAPIAGIVGFLRHKQRRG
jgi:hypothetical protein